MPITVARTGEVRTWPHGFGATLPTDHWQVVHSLPRQEKRLAQDLEQRGIAGLIFLENRVRYYRKSTQVFQVPLLGGYLFVHLDRERRLELYETQRIVRVIDVADPTALARDLAALRALLEAAGEQELLVKPELMPGKPVLITQGIFAGCTGIVQRRKDNAHLIVNLSILGQSVATAIPLATAELLTSA